MRLQIDFMAPGARVGLAFPPHLRDYIPNPWGSPVTPGQQFFASLEEGTWSKGMAIVATRTLWNEELFVDTRLNPRFPSLLPAGYRHIDEAAAARTWKGILE